METTDIELDPVAVLAALGWKDTDAIAPVAGGWDTALWRVARDGRAYALRVFRPEQAETCRLEVAALAAADAAGLPVPEVHAAGSWHDRPALLLTWCDGRPALDVAWSEPRRIRSLGVLLGRTHAAIHAIPTPAAIREAASWLDWKGPTDPRLRERLCRLPLRDDALLHLDYHPLNVMVAGDRVSGVLDWANVHAGDPRADLARTVTILRLASAPPDALPLRFRTARRILEAGWRRGYQQVAGPIGDLSLFYAWAGAAMERDLAAKIGRPGIWLTERDLAPIRQWTAHWSARAGVRDAR